MWGYASFFSVKRVDSWFADARALKSRHWDESTVGEAFGDLSD